MASLQQIISWFQTGLFPTSDQFRQTWLSYWHKSEKIPQSQIFGLQETIEAATRGLIYQNPVTNVADLYTTYPNAKVGWAAMVTSVGYIYSYNSTAWANTGLKEFPEDVATNEDVGYKKTSAILPTVAYNPNPSTGNFYLNNVGSIINGFNGDKVTDYIPVKPNTYYRYIGRFTDYRGYAEYNSSKSRVAGNNALTMNPTTKTVTEFKFKTGANTAYLRFSVYQLSEYQLYEESQDITETLSYIQSEIDDIYSKIEGIEVDFVSDIPDYLFAIDNDSSNFYAREYIQYLYPEGLLGELADIQVNDSRLAPIQSRTKNAKNVETTSVGVTLSGTGYKTKTQNTSLVKTKSSVAKNKSIRYLAIGDSITANEIPNNDGQYRGGWCFPSVAKEILMKDNVDFGDNAINMLLIGTTNRRTTSFDYKGGTLSLRGMSEGRGSWTTCNYLRHAAHTTTTASGTGSTYDNKAAWDAMGLGRKIPIGDVYNESADYETYTYTSIQRNLIRTTPWGFYHWDYSVELWNKAKEINLNGIMTGAGDYTGSEADKQRLDDYMNYRLDNPTNPFYDRNIAKNNDYAFSLQTYLNRYKTLADDGVTRLVVGSTAGTEIKTTTTLNNIDVCTPTHITLELGENERWWFPATAQNAVDDNRKLMEIINTEFPSILIGFVNPRYIGVMYPNKWADIAVCGSFTPVGSNKFKYDMNTIMKSSLGALSTQSVNYFLPCYYTQTPLYRSATREDISLMDNSTVLVGGTDVNHPGLGGYWSIGYQVLAWIYYTLSK